MAETILALKPYAIAIAGGVLPSIFWLWFWLREDRNCPEPTGLVALSFAAGMAVVYFVLPVQKVVVAALPAIMHALGVLALKFSFALPVSETVQMVLWAAAEEIGKFATVFLIAFHTRDFDEPIDAVIYLITVALGFAAMENTLYILKDLAVGGGVSAMINSNLRFIGATIVHISSSALVGIAIAFSFHSTRFVKSATVVLGLFLATLLHTYFNLSIMEANGTKETLLVFAQFWGVILVIIVLLQIVKRLQKTCQVN